MTTPAQTANVFGNDNIVVQANGSGVNVEVTAGRPHLRLTRYAKLTERAAREPSDMALLSAFRRDVAPLIGRKAELAALRGWLAAPADLSLRVMVGGAGRGKTRLAAEFCHEVSGAWLAGFVGPGEFERFRREGHTAQWRWDKPTLVVVDEAGVQATALKDWLRELVDASLEDRPKLRLLLLDRQAQREIGWLADLLGGGQDEESMAKIGLLDPSAPVELAPLQGAAFRRDLFAALLAKAKPGIAAPQLGEEADFDRSLTELKWCGEPLFLMMAALVAAETGVAGALALSRTQLADRLAARELDRIGRLGAARGIDPAAAPPGRFLRRLAALATLTQGATAEAARALAADEAQALGASVDLDTVVVALKQALPGAEPGKPIGAIQPDIIGEAALLAIFGEGGEASAAGAPTAPRIAAAARTALAAASAFLVRAAQDFAVAGRLEPIRWLQAITDAPETDLGALMDIANALPSQTVALLEFGLGLQQKICEGARAQLASKGGAGVESALATGLNNLAGRMLRLGRREDALAAAQEGLSIRRRLAAENPAGYEPLLAGALLNISAFWSELAEQEKAASVTQEAKDIYVRLDREKPGAYAEDLAMCMVNLAAYLSRMGRREDALAAGREAVAAYRKVAAAKPEVGQPYLAGALGNLSGDAIQLSLGDEALATSWEAVEICRRLNAERPDANLPGLASALSKRGTVLARCGLAGRACDAAGEAVEIYGRLAAAKPKAFGPDLANALCTQSANLEAAGKRKEAVDAAEKACRIFRLLARKTPAAFLPELGRALLALGRRLNGFQRSLEAVPVLEEAKGVYHQLNEKQPDGRLDAFADTLVALADSYTQTHRQQDGIDAAEEAVAIRRRLAASRKETDLVNLAGALGSIGSFLLRDGEIEGAFGAVTEAIVTLRPVFLQRPQAYKVLMATMLNQYSARAAKLGRAPDEALAAPLRAQLEALETPVSPPST